MLTAVYAAKHMLPSRRLQKQMAVVAAAMVGGDFENYVLEYREPVETTEAAIEELTAITGRQVRRIPPRLK